MTNFKFTDKDKRTLLFITFHPESATGIGNITRLLLKYTHTQFNWVVLAATPNAVIDPQWYIDGDVCIYTIDRGMGNKSYVDKLDDIYQFDGLVCFNDPHNFYWLFNEHRYFRKKFPIIYYNIWDTLPYPYFNKPFYEACDALLAISKQTENINKVVLGESAKNKIIRFIPHGIDSEEFYPIDENHKEYDDLKLFKEYLFGGKEYDTVFLFNSVNTARKNIADMLVAYADFYNRLSEKEQERVCFILKTDPYNQQGVNITMIHQALFGSYRKGNIMYHNRKMSTREMNLLYNAVDCTVLCSTQEGWGLSITESVMAGTPFIGNVTGGIQDQMRFSRNGKWIEFNENFPSNSSGSVSEVYSAEWCFPVYPSVRTIMSNNVTSYLSVDIPNTRDIAANFYIVHKIAREYRKKYGMSGRKWMMSDEAGMEAKTMSKRFADAIDETIDKFIPVKSYEIVNANNYKSNIISYI